MMPIDPTSEGPLHNVDKTVELRCWETSTTLITVMSRVGGLWA